jgi:hypothetical protein
MTLNYAEPPSLPYRMEGVLGAQTVQRTLAYIATYRRKVALLDMKSYASWVRGKSPADGVTRPYEVVSRWRPLPFANIGSAQPGFNARTAEERLESMGFESSL